MGSGRLRPQGGVGAGFSIDCSGKAGAGASGSGPGSRPPARRTRVAMRCSMGGCVAQSETPRAPAACSSSMAWIWLGRTISARPSIRRRAAIMASASPVICTAPASARYSRLRDRAMRRATDNTPASTTMIRPMTRMAALMPPPSRDDPRRPRQVPPLDVPPPGSATPPPRCRRSRSKPSVMMPVKMAAITARRASPLRMWVSSCASTADSSRSSSASTRPRVTVTLPFLRSRPEAKALRAGLSITARRGMTSPRAMHRVSIKSHRRRSVSRDTTRAPETASMIA